MKTVIKTNNNGGVTITRDTDFGIVTATYTCPIDGGYVTDDNGQQVCDRLCSRGSTLMSNSRSTLVDIIRREYQRAYAFARREHISAHQY